MRSFHPLAMLGALLNSAFPIDTGVQINHPMFTSFPAVTNEADPPTSRGNHGAGGRAHRRWKKRRAAGITLRKRGH